MSEIRRHYWDSGVFLSAFNKEPGKFSIVADLLKDAHAGKAEIVTSSLTLVEVLYVKGSAPLKQEQEAKLELFFQYPFIKIVNAERGICERARQFCWKYHLRPKDAIHVATAEFAAKIVTIHDLFSWDSDFTSLNGKIPGIAFPIREPYMHQGLLPLEDNPSPETPPAVAGS